MGGPRIGAIVLVALTAACGLGDEEDAVSGACRPGTARGIRRGNVFGIVQTGSKRVCIECDPGEYCPGGTERSVPCGWGSWDDDGDPATMCVFASSCAPSTYVLDEGDARHDRVCGGCPIGTYTERFDEPRCLPATPPACEPGTTPSAPSTTSAPFCDYCPPGTFCAGGTTAPVACATGTWDDDDFAGTACAAWSTCHAGERVAGIGSATVDRPCPACGESAFSTQPMAKTCEARTTCPPGTYALPPRENADRVCLPCPAGTTSTTENAATCGTVKSLVLGATQSCVVMADETHVTCWGSGVDAFGVPAARPLPVPVVVASGVRTATVGELHACAITKNDVGVITKGGDVVCWGSNAWGQLGPDVSGTFTTAPARSYPLAGGNLQLRATARETFVLGTDGHVRSWGGTIDEFGSPWNVIAEPRALWRAFDLAVSAEQTCVVDHLAGVRCMGADRVVTRTAVPGALAVVVGRAHVCVRDDLGGVRCFGDGSRGQLGDGTTTSRLTAAPVSGVASTFGLAAGADHACALVGAGEVVCWGANEHGQLGDGTTVDRASPALVAGLVDVVAIAAGDRHTCALRVDGAVLCWGDNGRGQLGDGTTEPRAIPAPVQGL